MKAAVQKELSDSVIVAESASGIVATALKKAEAVHAARVAELATLSSRNESACQLIGFLKDEPEIVGALHQAAKEHRQALYY